jgi:hypothetical protein
MMRNGLVRSSSTMRTAARNASGSAACRSTRVASASASRIRSGSNPRPQDRNAVSYCRASEPSHGRMSRTVSTSSILRGGVPMIFLRTTRASSSSPAAEASRQCKINKLSSGCSRSVARRAAASAPDRSPCCSRIRAIRCHDRPAASGESRTGVTTRSAPVRSLARSRRSASMSRARTTVRCTVSGPVLVGRRASSRATRRRAAARSRLAAGMGWLIPPGMAPCCVIVWTSCQAQL